MSNNICRYQYSQKLRYIQLTNLNTGYAIKTNNKVISVQVIKINSEQLNLFTYYISINSA